MKCSYTRMRGGLLPHVQLAVLDTRTFGQNHTLPPPKAQPFGRDSATPLRPLQRGSRRLRGTYTPNSFCARLEIMFAASNMRRRGGSAAAPLLPE